MMTVVHTLNNELYSYNIMPINFPAYRHSLKDLIIINLNS